MRQPPNELHKLDHPQVRKLKHPTVHFVANGHFAQIESRSNHFVGQEDRVEEILVSPAVLRLTPNLIIVYKENQLVDRNHHVVRCVFFHVDGFDDFELEDVLVEAAN